VLEDLQSSRTKVLRGQVNMTKISGPRTEPWGTLQEDLYQEDRSVSHLTRKQRDDRYDLNQLRTEPWIPNQDERGMIKMSWSIVSKATDRSSRHRHDTFCGPIASTDEVIVDVQNSSFRSNDVCSRLTGENCEK